jgi:hypothetical protein
MTRLGTSPLALAVLAAGTMVGGLACTGSVTDALPNGTPGTGSDPGAGARPNPTPGAPGNPGPSTPVSSDDAAGPLPLRRLTINEYNNTIRDLIGADAPVIDASTGVSGDVEAFEHGFLKGSTVGSANDARLFSTLADAVAASAMARLGTLLPQGCATPNGTAEEGCAKKFIEEFGLRAFRRPLSNDEKADLLALYTRVRGAEVGLTFPEAMRTLISGMLQSPMFTYRWELGTEAGAGPGGLVPLDSYGMASRLSYTIMATMPDAELFAAAAANQLNSSDKIADQARRLLASEKAKLGLREFIVQWMVVSSLPTVSKDEAFTNYTPAVGEAMLRESGAFFAAIMQGKSSKLEDLFTSSASFIDGPLAKLYGVTSVTGPEQKPVSLNPAQRAGILTLGAFTAGQSDAGEPHPVRRGLLILDKVLCTPIIPPPNFVPPPVKDVAPNISNRKRFEESTLTDVSCSACHGRINNAGFAFENYDAVGGWRDIDAGQPVNASGSFPFASGEVPFKNGVEFSKAIATSQEARDCFTKQFLEYSLRRPVLASEQGSIKAMSEAFAASGYDLKELLVATTKTRAFTHRMPLAGEGQQ